MSTIAQKSFDKHLFTFLNYIDFFFLFSGKPLTQVDRYSLGQTLFYLYATFYIFIFKRACYHMICTPFLSKSLLENQSPKTSMKVILISTSLFEKEYVTICPSVCVSVRLSQTNFIESKKCSKQKLSHMYK